MQDTEREDTERIERLEKLIGELIRANQRVPVVVEGERDVLCLRKLGLQGLILKIHRGQSLYEFATDLSDRYPQIILLTDWDPKGDQLHERLSRDLGAEGTAYSTFRQTLRTLCDPDIREIEQIGSQLHRLKNRLQADPQSEGG